jgi:hypothetical protein
VGIVGATCIGGESMTDDIVTRLRYIYSQKDVGVSVNPETFTEASDEIERLRADRDNWKDLASEYYHLDPKCECHLCDRFRKAMDDGDR